MEKKTVFKEKQKETTEDTDYTTQPVPIEIEYKGIAYKGLGVPVKSSCRDGLCFEFFIKLNDEDIGFISHTAHGWKMKNNHDQEFVDAIGEDIFLWYE